MPTAAAAAHRRARRRHARQRRRPRRPLRRPRRRGARRGAALPPPSAAPAPPSPASTSDDRPRSKGRHDHVSLHHSRRGLAPSASPSPAARRQPQPADAAANNPSLYSVHQPVVERTNFVFDLHRRRRRRVRRRAGAARAPGSTRSTLATATASRSTSRAAMNRPARARDVARVAADYGLLLADGRAGHRGRGRRRASVRVVASRATAQRRRLPELGRSAASTRRVRTVVQLRLRDQFEPRRDDRQSRRPGPRPGRLEPAAARSTAGRAIRTYRESSADRPPGPSGNTTHDGQVRP